MFAFALWDAHDHVLWLARDRFGEKPLYYGWFSGTLVFASELKALRGHPLFHGEVDRDVLGLYMRYGYVPTPHCIYRELHKLPQGSFLRLRGTKVDPDTAPELYWSANDVALAAADRRFTGVTSDAVNELGIGPQGLGGRSTAFRVHVEVAATHITMNPVAVNIQCHSARRANAVITPGGIDFK